MGVGRRRRRTARLFQIATGRFIQFAIIVQCLSNWIDDQSLFMRKQSVTNVTNGTNVMNVREDGQKIKRKTIDKDKKRERKRAVD